MVYLNKKWVALAALALFSCSPDAPSISKAELRTQPAKQSTSPGNVIVQTAPLPVRVAADLLPEADFLTATEQQGLDNSPVLSLSQKDDAGTDAIDSLRDTGKAEAPFTVASNLLPLHATVELAPQSGSSTTDFKPCSLLVSREAAPSGNWLVNLEDDSACPDHEKIRPLIEAVSIVFGPKPGSQ